MSTPVVADKAMELMFQNEKFVVGLGTPTHMVGTKEDSPEDFFWKEWSTKGSNRWIMRKSAVDLGLIYE